jgi:hypothetical protein
MLLPAWLDWSERRGEWRIAGASLARSEPSSRAGAAGLDYKSIKTPPKLPSNETSGQPILVTGAHRSGTTWVGKMLAASGRVAYLSEPLNVLHRPGVMRAPVDCWYTYICADNEDHYLPALRETLAYDYHYWPELRSLRSVKDGLRMARDSSAFLRGKIFNLRPLLKDPFAVFSAGWFAERLGCQVVLVVRHPAAVVSSLVRLGWPFDLGDLLHQPLLMRDWLEPFRADLENAIRDGESVVARASLLWSMVYSVVGRLAADRPNLVVVRHEDLSLDPEWGFRQLYQELGLAFNNSARQAVLQSSASGNPKQVSQNAAYATRLDSRANLSNWKKRLGAEDVQRVRSLTAQVASQFYSPEDWG